MSGKVIVKSGVRKKAVRIDGDGNVVDPKTGEILERPRTEYVPTADEIKKAMMKPPVDPYKRGEIDADPAHPEPLQSIYINPPENNPLQKIIATKVQEAVAKEIGKIDIGSMVSKAIEDAFK